MLEAQVYRFTELLSEQRAATKENVTRKQARTGEERDESDDEGEAGDSDDDEDDVPYNPKNLPLGWDGKVRKLLVMILYKKNNRFNLGGWAKIYFPLSDISHITLF